MKEAELEKGANGPFFSHDAMSHADPKIRALVFNYGWRGYGHYWRINEELRLQPDYKLDTRMPAFYDNLASMLTSQKDTEVSSNYVQTYLEDCINKFHLYEHKNGFLYSNSLIRRMRRMDATREGKSRGGKRSAEVRSGGSPPKIVPSMFEDTSNSGQQTLNIKQQTINYCFLKKRDLEGKSQYELVKVLFSGLKFETHPLAAEPDIQQAWIRYMEVRRKRKWNTFAKSAQDLWAELWQLAGSSVSLAVKIIDQSSDKPWRDFYELKTKTNLQSNNSNNNSNGPINDRYNSLEQQIRDDANQEG